MNSKTLTTYYYFLFILFFASVTLNAQTPPTTPQKKDTTKIKAVSKSIDTLKIDSITKLPYAFKSHQKGSLFLNNISNFESFSYFYFSFKINRF